MTGWKWEKETEKGRRNKLIKKLREKERRTQKNYIRMNRNIWVKFDKEQNNRVSLGPPGGAGEGAGKGSESTGAGRFLWIG